MPIQSLTNQSLKTAAQFLWDGKLVAFPTETVYGLGANALNGDAIANVFAAKNRPQFNPLITHVPDLHTAMQYGSFDTKGLEIADRFWPGPLTLIVKKAKECKVHDLATAGLETIALRVPAHKGAQALLRQSGLPLVAPSANPSGRLSPTTPQHVAEALGDKVAMILADGRCQIGLESTVLDLTQDQPTILRPGAIMAEDIKAATGITPLTHNITTDTPKSPGQTLRHYAPQTPLRLNAVDVAPDEALLAFGSLKFMGVQGGGFAKDLPASHRQNLSESADLHEAAGNLFAMLRTLDQSKATKIAVMNIPETGLGIAINDRLSRAAQS